MKKIISIILITLLFVSSVFAMTGCIFNDGSEDEVHGVYGVDRMFYKDYAGMKHIVAGDFEYYLLVLNDDDEKTGKVIMKPVDGKEKSYDVSYYFEYDSSDGKVVKYVKVKDFRPPVYSETTYALSFAEPQEVSFTLYPKREDIVFSRIHSKIDDGLKTSKNLLEFHKISGKTTERKIERAKKQQIRNRDKRAENGEDN